jgi:hypothetical protein
VAGTIARKKRVTAYDPRSHITKVTGKWIVDKVDNR